MTPEKLQHAELLDIIFDNRNKNYGAYELRTHFQQRMLKGLMGGLSVPLLFLLAYQFFQLLQPKPNSSVIDKSGLVVREIIIPLEKEIEIEKVEIKKQEVKQNLTKAEAAASNHIPVRQEKYVNFELVPDQEAKDLMPTAKDLETALVGLEKTDGKLAEPGQITGSGTGNQSGLGNGLGGLENGQSENKVFEKVERMPEFPGGKTALYRFLNRHIQPQDHLEAGTTVRILVQFVVDENGKVGSFTFLEGVEEELKKEIIRVMNKMPNWTPGLQNGKEVKVYFRIPFVFSSEEN